MAKRAAKKAMFPLLEHLDRQMARLHENLAAALETFDDDAVHDTRVATRRMKAALELLQPVLARQHRKSLAQGLKKLRRRLGPLRDVEVMMDHLSRLAKDRRHSQAAEWLRHRLEESRTALREQSQGGSSVEKELRRIADWPLVRADISDAAEGVDRLLAESLHLQTDAFIEQADRLVANFAAGGASATAGEEEAAEVDAPRRQNPHDLRIAGKALRYTLEMAEAQGHSPGAGLMKSFKRMQDLLGTWHDLVVLADAALKEVVASELNHHEASASDRVLDLAKVAVKRSRQELLAFCRLWSQKGEDLTGHIRSLFPLTRSAVGVEATEAARTAQPEPLAQPGASTVPVEAVPDGEASSDVENPDGRTRDGVAGVS